MQRFLYVRIINMEMDYTFFYVEANIVCIIIFAILLFKNIYSVDRQEKQLIFDRVLIFSMLYFANDCFWALLLNGSIYGNRYCIDIVNLLNSVFLSLICYNWFLYIEVSQGVKYITKRFNRFLTFIPALLSISIMTVLCIFFDRTVIDPNNNLTDIYYAVFLTDAAIYIPLSALASFRRAFRKENYALRSQYIICALYPLGVGVSGFVQTLFLNAPLFCFGCTIMMVYMYIMSLDSMVSLDPLTNLNNRAQLRKYISNDLKISEHGEKIFLFMIDLNKFKYINDTYGHVEGDKAIIRASQALKIACSGERHRHFIARYGGDEFIIVARIGDERDASDLRDRIKKTMISHNDESGASYELNAAVGYSEYSGRIEDFQSALKAADDALYADKNEMNTASHT